MATIQRLTRQFSLAATARLPIYKMTFFLHLEHVSVIVLFCFEENEKNEIWWAVRASMVS
jgi:hypothetical protein